VDASSFLIIQLHHRRQIRLYSTPRSQRGHSQYQCGQGQQEKHDRQTEGVIAPAEVSNDGRDKKQNKTDRGGYSDERNPNADQQSDRSGGFGNAECR
jgi:hypothetical protein